MSNRCEHHWTPLFKSPTCSNTQELRIAALFLLRYSQDTARVCSICGKHGYQSRGYARGGAQLIRAYSAGYSPEFVAEAEAWNARVATELKAQEVAQGRMEAGR